MNGSGGSAWRPTGKQCTRRDLIPIGSYPVCRSFSPLSDRVGSGQIGNDPSTIGGISSGKTKSLRCPRPFAGNPVSAPGVERNPKDSLRSNRNLWKHCQSYGGSQPFPGGGRGGRNQSRSPDHPLPPRRRRKGGLGGYLGGPAAEKRLLELEGAAPL